MSEEYGGDFITVIDDDGNELELEYLDTLEWNGCTYMAFLSDAQDGSTEEDSEECGVVILKTIVEDGEELLSTLDNDDELEEVYAQFMELFFSDEDAE